MFLCIICINFGKQRIPQPRVCLIKSKFCTFPLNSNSLRLGFYRSSGTLDHFLIAGYLVTCKLFTCLSFPEPLGHFQPKNQTKEMLIK